MEQHFLDVAKRAWEAAGPAPAPQPPWSPILEEDRRPGPLPLYPVLGAPAGHRDAPPGPLLCSPCWRLPSVYQRYRDFTGARSSWDASAAQPSPGPSPETSESPDTPETPASPAEPARQPEPAEETAASQRLSRARPPSAGDRLQITGNSEGARPAERRPARAAAGRRGHPVFSACLRWIRRAVRAAAGCCGIFVDVKEPGDCYAKDSSGGRPWQKDLIFQ
ncbi:annexin-2 receptor-like [Glossophaga mutica]